LSQSTQFWKEVTYASQTYVIPLQLGQLRVEVVSDKDFREKAGASRYVGYIPFLQQ
jgi:hypothetical protein